MTPEEMVILADKVKSGTATQEEQLQLLQLMNQAISEMRGLVKEAAIEKQKANITEIF